MTGKVFINHRRLLNEQDAEILFNRLVLGRHVSEADLFIDRRGLDGKADWKATLKAQVQASEIMVVVIGDGEIAGKPVRWLDITYPENHPKAGQRRLDDPEDLVRYEIVEAIDRGIPLVPVLVNGASMPARDASLPLDLWPLTKPQALELRTKSGALPENYVAKIGKVIADRRNELRRSHATISRALAGLLMFAAASLGGAVAFTGTTLLSDRRGAIGDLITRQFKEEIVEPRRSTERTNANTSASAPQFKEVDPSGPWGMEWRWVSPNCKGSYNLFVHHDGRIVVFGKSTIMDSTGAVLPNGRFFVRFTIETKKYKLTADGSIASGVGEAQLHHIAEPDGEPYCKGPVLITRGKIPDRFLGGGNGGN